MDQILDRPVDNSDWSALMAAAQSGDAAVYRRLLREISLWLRRYFAHRLPQSMIDDAVQDTLLAVHEKRRTYDPSRPFGPWLASIARYKWIDRIRAMKAAPTEMLDDDIPAPGDDAASTSAMSLRRLLRELRPAQADAIRLVKLEGLSIAEAAIRTGQSVSLVKVNIHRGIGRLKTMIQGESDAD
jgi:RNA polymerase sigma factor (sigma-70 family)